MSALAGSRIEAAAIRLEDGSIFSLPPPARHHDVIHYIRANGFAGDLGPDKQGFVTDTGRFMRRAPALRVAKQSGQIIHKTPPDNQLFSDDMW